MSEFARDIAVESRVLTPPPPGEESAGPIMFDLVKEINLAQEMGQQLLKETDRLFQRRTVVTHSNGTTDATGNADIRLYDVPQGFEFVTTRVNVEAVGFSPSAPFVNPVGAASSLIAGTTIVAPAAGQVFGAVLTPAAGVYTLRASAFLGPGGLAVDNGNVRVLVSAGIGGIPPAAIYIIPTSGTEQTFRVALDGTQTVQITAGVNAGTVGVSYTARFSLTEESTTLNASWIALIRGTNFGVGSILDFLPNPPASNGAVLPALFTDGADKAAIIRGGGILSLHLANGPALTDIYVRLQGFTKHI